MNAVSLLSIKPTVLQHYGLNANINDWPTLDWYLNGKEGPEITTFSHNTLTHHSIPRSFYKYIFSNGSWSYSGERIKVDNAP